MSSPGHGGSESSRLGRQVVVTGIGLVTPFGCGREISWEAIRSGQRATRWLDSTESLAGWAGAPAPELGDLQPESCGLGLPHEWTKSIQEPVVAMALWAANEAVRDSGLWSEFSQGAASNFATLCGCVVGTSKVGLRSFSRAFSAFKQTGELATSDWENLWPDRASRAISTAFQIRGPVLCPVAACASGLASVIRGAELVRTGECDVVLAGSSDASLLPIVLGSFQRLGVLARGFTDPARACQPFDANRSGFVIGEGSAVVVLESLEHAQARGATTYAELLAGGMVSDPSGITQVEPSGECLSWLIRDVMRRAEISPDEIDYINLHGTATRSNDVAESRAVFRALGQAAERPLCSGQKGAVGHLLGAAGSVETAITLLALRDQFAPPTVNLENRDSECNLNHVLAVARSAKLRNAMKISLGFGGHVTAAIFRRA